MEQSKAMECGRWKASSDVVQPHRIYKIIVESETFKMASM